MIDTHIHLGHWETDYFYGRYSTMEEIIAVYKDYDGIVLIPTEIKDNEGVVKAAKECNIDAKVGVWVDPTNVEDVEYMDFNLIKVHPAYSKVPISDVSYTTTIRLAEDKGVPIMCHAGEVETTNYKHIIKTAKAYPDVKFIIGHMGGRRYQNTWNCPLDAKPYPNLYIDTTMKIKGWMIKHCAEVVGSDRMLFGSDYPLMHPDVGIAAIKTSGLGEEDIQNILHNTAKNILFGE